MIEAHKTLQCLSAASSIINCVVDRILPSELIRYCPEYYFALSAFGTAVLIKVRRYSSITIIRTHTSSAVPTSRILLQNRLTPGSTYHRAHPTTLEKSQCCTNGSQRSTNTEALLRQIPRASLDLAHRKPPEELFRIGLLSAFDSEDGRAVSKPTCNVHSHERAAP